SAGLGRSRCAPVGWCGRPAPRLLTGGAAPTGGRDAGARQGQSHPTVSAR
ncbi:MAG: metallophosphoesterase, partial [Mycobacterium sp.]